MFGRTARVHPPIAQQEDNGVMLVKEQKVQGDAFQLTADPKFCYLDPARRHASARFVAKLYEGDGLYTLTGQSGIGKTTLLRHLAEQLTALDGVLPLCPRHVVACRTGTTLAEVLGACEAKLGLGEWGAVSPLKAAKRLQQLVESNRSPALLLDEADLLADDVLEALVTLTGLQAAERRLLSIVLAGHPSIPGRVSTIAGNDEVLGASRTVELEPMAEPDVARLIRYRLCAAGRAEDAIGPDAIAQIARHCAGVPGVVVRVCRRVMQLAENRSRKSVTADIVAEAIGEETFDVQQRSSRPEFIASAPMSTTTTEPSSRPATSRSPITARVPSPNVESRPVKFPKPRDTALAPEPSLVREPHWSIPEVALGRPSQRTTRSDQPVQNLLGRNRRLKLMLVWAGVFPVVLVAGLAVLSGNLHELADRVHTLAVAGAAHLHSRDHGAARVDAGASRAYDSSTALPTTSVMAPPDRGAAPVTTPTPLPSPTIEATEGATLAETTAPLEEDIAVYRAAPAAIEKKLSRPASQTEESAPASVSPPATVSESASNKVTRMQLAARMQGREPGPPIDLPVRLSKGQARTIYFFTELHGLSGRTVLHRWERNGRIMQERQLHPTSQLWRAYTAMTIVGDMRGSWGVSAVDATTRNVLAGQHFEVE
jgi:type II secretory pathway predicted ATPase ExeA